MDDSEPARGPRGPAPHDDLGVELPRSATAAALGRRFVDDELRRVMTPDTSAAVKLIVTELINNAVLHGEGRITLQARLVDDGHVRLAVVDEGTGRAPEIRDRSDEDPPGGWGLQIVEALSTRWGAFEGTTHVWAEVRVA